MSKNNSTSSNSREKTSSRRSFMKTTAAAGAVSLAAGTAPSVKASPVKSGGKLRVGALAVGAFSFWPYSWGDILSRKKKVNRGTLETDVLNMEITHVWDVNPEEARKFASLVGAEVVDRYDDMVGKVDGVAFGGYYETPWQNKLARPYIEAGIPTCISRPFAYSLRDIDDLLDCAAKHGTPIMATDVYEHLYGAKTLKARLKNVGEIECVHGTCLANEYPALFHSKYMILNIFGSDVGKISVITDDPNTSSYLVGIYLFNGWSGQKPFPCSLSMTPGGDLYSFTVFGTEGIETERLPQIPDWQDDLLTHHVPMLVDMQRTFEGNNYEPYESVRKKTELFLTGFYSALERNGAPVDVGTVPIDWRAKPIEPGWIDESIFKSK